VRGGGRLRELLLLRGRRGREERRGREGRAEREGSVHRQKRRRVFPWPRTRPADVRPGTASRGRPARERNVGFTPGRKGWAASPAPRSFATPCRAWISG